jgi:hypothetical protein
MPFATAYTRTGTYAPSGTIPAADLNSIQDDLGGQVQSIDVSSGVSDGTVTRRGAVSILPEETRANPAYGVLSTPDQVTNVVLATNGKLRIGYSALWRESVLNAARAAIFIGANQLQIRSGNATAPKTSAAAIPNIGGNTAQVTCILLSTPAGLYSHGDSGVLAPMRETNPPNGQALGESPGGANAPKQPTFEFNGVTETSGFDGTTYSIFPWGGVCEVFAAAGTYTVSVQFKASTGTVFVKERHLWVEAEGP